MNHRVKIKDRRQYPRYLLGLPVEVRRGRSPAPGLEEGAFEGVCIDLSQGGVRFRTRTLFHSHEKLELTVFSKEGSPELRCEIEVVRSFRIPRQYEVAARISRLLPTDDVQPSSPT